MDQAKCLDFEFQTSENENSFEDMEIEDAEIEKAADGNETNNYHFQIDSQEASTSSSVQNIPLILSSYFQLTSAVTDYKGTGKCLFCVKSKTFVGNLRATSNLLRHLNSAHPEAFKKYKQEVSDKDRLKQNRKRTRDSSLIRPNPLGFQPLLNKASKKQTEFDINLVDYIVNSLKPFSTVEDKSFIKLFSFDKDIKVMPRKRLMRLISERNKLDHDETVNALAKIDSVCTVADIWSTKHHGFMGISCHWIDDHLQRHGRVLACQNFKNPHTGERIAEVICSVHDNYNLEVGKIVSTITDNASNMIRAFKLFGVDMANIDDDDMECTSQTEAPVLEPEQDDFQPDQDNDLTDVDLTDVYLPKHQRCAAHTINLVATTDYKKIVDKSKFKAIHYKAFAKCSHIWNGSRRPKGSEAIGEIIGKQIGYPVPTRWNSLYDCTEELLSHEKNLSQLIDVTTTPKSKFAPFTTSELTYLKEYVTLMKPLAKGLDFLQGDKNTFYGRLVPTLFSIKAKLESLQFGSAQLKIINDTIPQIIESFKIRFNAALSLEESAKVSIIAAVSHPQFKLRWLCDENLAKARDLFVAAVNKVETRNNSTETENFHLQNTSDDDFLVLRPNINSTLDNQALKFLADQRTDLQSLECYPAVKKVFKIHNTPLCSSASIERVFNFAGILNHPKRGSILPSNFEMCIVMKGNKVFKDQEN